MQIRPYFAWYDLWVGAFYDQDKCILYIQLVPCCGVKIIFRQAPRLCTETKSIIFERMTWYLLAVQLQKITGWCDG